MRPDVAINLEQWFADYVRPFCDGGAEADIQRFKRDHCRRVAEDMRGIARDIALTDDEVCTAWMLGLLHDVGRFTQYARFRTLRDDRSINHGQAGLQVLEDARVLADCESQDREIIREGIGLHNRRNVPDTLDAGVRRFVLMIRDADKLDIMQTLYDAWKNDEIRSHPELILELNLEGNINPDILDDLRSRRAIAYKNIKSLADLFLTQISWVYDINFRPTYQRLTQRRLLEQVAEVLSKEAGVRDEVAAAIQYVRERL